MDPLFDLFYNQKTTYAKKLQFQIIIIMICISLFLFVFVRNNYGFLILLFAFLYFVSSNYLQMKKSEITDFNQITMIKLQTLQDISNKYILSLSKLGYSQKAIDTMLKNNILDSLYLDANLISFLYSIIDINEFNPREFFILLKNTNNLLRIRRQIEEYIDSNNGETPENISEMFEMALQYKTYAKNNMHNFIYSIPKMQKMFKYIENIIERYTLLISRNTDIINAYNQYHLKNTNINTMTKFVSYNNTKPFDIYENYSSNITKNKNFKNKSFDFYV